MLQATAGKMIFGRYIEPGMMPQAAPQAAASVAPPRVAAPTAQQT